MQQPRAIGAFYDGRDVVSWTRRPDGVRDWRRVRAEHACYLRNTDLTDDVRSWLQKSRVIKSRHDDGTWTRIGFIDRDTCWRACSDRVRIPGVGGFGNGLFPGMGLKTYEADLHPVRRWIIEQDVQLIKPRRCYLDFEADSRVHPDKKELARILSWTIGDHEGNYVQGILTADTDHAERELLLDLFDELEAYDQVVAWYGDDYDFPLANARAERLRMKRSLQEWICVDFLPVFERMNISASKSGDEKQSMSLDAVARSVAGVSKLEGVDGSMTWQLWSEDAAFLQDLCRRVPSIRGMTGREILARYNCRDVYAMVKIEEKVGYLDLHNTLCQTCGVVPDTRGANPLQYVDNFIVTLARKTRNERGPTMFSRGGGDDEVRFEGAYVQEPTRLGFINDVHVADFASMYPSIIISWNMSPETLTDDVLVESMPSYLLHTKPQQRPIPEGCCATPNGTVFRREPMGLLVMALQALLDLRKEWTVKKDACSPGSPEWVEADRRATAYKIAANSFYGVVGCIFFRWYTVEVAHAVTSTGQWMLKQVIERGVERAISALYGDTDSNFATDTTEAAFAAFVQWCNQEHFPGELARMKTPRNTLKLAYEKAFATLVMCGKKRYAGRYLHYKGKRADEKSKPEIKGLEFKRGDAPKLARAMQAECLDIMLGGGVTGPVRETWDHRLETFVALVERWRQRCMVEPITLAEVQKSQTLRKELKDYKVKQKKDGTNAAQPAHVQIGNYLKERGIVLQQGSKIEYFVSDGSSGGPLKVVWSGEWSGECDRYYLWDDIVFPPTQRVLEACFPEVRWKDYLEKPKAKKLAKALDKAFRGLGKKPELLKPPKRYNPNQRTLFGSDGGINA